MTWALTVKTIVDGIHLCKYFNLYFDGKIRVMPQTFTNVKNS